MTTPARDDQILFAVQTALTATQQFDAVLLAQLPEEAAFPAGGKSVAYISPGGYGEDSRHFDASGPTYRRTMRYTLTIATRNSDKVARDAELSRLGDVCQDALTGVSLGVLCVPAWTGCKAGKYLPPAAPERRMTLSGEVSVIVVGYSGRDATASVV